MVHRDARAGGARGAARRRVPPIVREHDDAAGPARAAITFRLSARRPRKTGRIREPRRWLIASRKTRNSPHCLIGNLTLTESLPHEGILPVSLNRGTRGRRGDDEHEEQTRTPFHRLPTLCPRGRCRQGAHPRQVHRRGRLPPQVRPRPAEPSPRAVPTPRQAAPRADLHPRRPARPSSESGRSPIAFAASGSSLACPI
jgi:hypothetical protein